VTESSHDFLFPLSPAGQAAGRSCGAAGGRARGAGAGGPAGSASPGLGVLGGTEPRRAGGCCWPGCPGTTRWKPSLGAPGGHWDGPLTCTYGHAPVCISIHTDTHTRMRAHLYASERVYVCVCVCIDLHVVAAWRNRQSQAPRLRAGTAGDGGARITRLEAKRGFSIHQHLLDGADRRPGRPAVPRMPCHGQPFPAPGTAGDGAVTSPPACPGIPGTGRQRRELERGMGPGDIPGRASWLLRTRRNHWGKSHRANTSG